jgi:hypothetical protein
MALDQKTGMSIFIAVIMIVSVIGFALTMGEPGQQEEYNSHKFTRTNAGWKTKIDGKSTEFLTFPSELENIPFDEGAKTAMEDVKVMWFVYNPKELYSQEVADALFYMEEMLNNADTLYVQRALTNSTGYALPEISCANATVSVPVLILQSGNETSIKHENGCITATAEDGRDIYRIADRLLYQAFGVME